MRLAYRAHLAWSLQCGPPNFVTFNLGFILTYPIDLICVDFCGFHSMTSPKFFMLSFYLCLNFHFSLSLSG